MFLSGETSFSTKKAYEYNDIEYPDDCIVDFDMRLIDLFRELDKDTVCERTNLPGILSDKRVVGWKVPTRMELFTYMDDDIYRYVWDMQGKSVSQISGFFV